MDHELFVKPERLLRELRELLVGDPFDVHTRKVVPYVGQTLTDPLRLVDLPGVYQFTSRLWRGEMISESCPISPKRNSESLSTTSLSPSR